MRDNDLKAELIKAVKSAYSSSENIRIRGAGTKFFYGNSVTGTMLDVGRHTGVISYEPSELVITARAGTRLSVMSQILADARQMLAFEPAWFGGEATLGGTVACGFSGPRRPFAGAARDFVLGINGINGKGEYLSFGGQVIKNVAGYDVSRLMVGALGTLGVICEVSLKVLPQPPMEITCVQELSESAALAEMTRLMRLPLPLSGLSYCAGLLRIRLSGSESGVQAAQSEVGGEVAPEGDQYWLELKEQRLNFFNRNQSLWRLSVAATSPALRMVDDCLVDWGGALRWVYTDKSPEVVFEVAQSMGGHATMFRSNAAWPTGRFTPLRGFPADIHSRLKSAFDPKRILNPGILYADC